MGVIINGDLLDFLAELCDSVGLGELCCTEMPRSHYFCSSAAVKILELCYA